MKPCILCGTLTPGSIGAAGLRWSSICQPCKDAEDAALFAQVQSYAVSWGPRGARKAAR